MRDFTRTLTFKIIPIIIIVILIYDYVAVRIAGTEASISSLIIAFSYKMPMFTFLTGFFIGLLSGHLFWRMRTNNDTVEIDEELRK